MFLVAFLLRARATTVLLVALGAQCRATFLLGTLLLLIRARTRLMASALVEMATVVAVVAVLRARFLFLGLALIVALLLLALVTRTGVLLTTLLNRLRALREISTLALGGRATLVIMIIVALVMLLLVL